MEQITLYPVDRHKTDRQTKGQRQAGRQCDDLHWLADTTLCYSAPTCHHRKDQPSF
jgi:hypothetical protein